MSEFSSHILNWYEQHARVLPWRGHPDPYAVWVSEIMLQQTQVDTVIPYFERWLAQFPTVQALADSSEQAVLSAWEGLGYYSRARNLHKAAKIIAAEHAGQLPSDLTSLRRLPGIGRYTAAAIASIAFDQDVATLDGNLKRVFSRIFDVSLPADTSAGEEALWVLAETHLPLGRAGDYNQALMDLGATICRPKKPLCLLCPVQSLCQAYALGIQEQRPVTKPRPLVPHKIKVAAVLVRDGSVLLALRPASGLLGGLWEFPAAEADAAEALVSVIEAEYRLKVDPQTLLGTFHHAYTHFKVTEFAYCCDLIGDVFAENLRWVKISELSEFPMGKIDRAISKKL